MRGMEAEEKGPQDEEVDEEVEEGDVAVHVDRGEQEAGVVHPDPQGVWMPLGFNRFKVHNKDELSGMVTQHELRGPDETVRYRPVLVSNGASHKDKLLFKPRPDVIKFLISGFYLDGATPPPLVDCSVNLAAKHFDHDRVEVLQRAKQAGITAMSLTGYSLETTKAALRYCQEYCMEHGQSIPELYFTAGVHPHFIPRVKLPRQRVMKELRELASMSRCVAVGESGLDFFRQHLRPDEQEAWLEEHVKLAVELQKPLLVSCRDAAPRLVTLLKRYPLKAPVVLHSFTGDRGVLRDLMDAGLSADLYFGISGWVTDHRVHRNGSQVLDCVGPIPLDRVLLETDAPFQVPRNISPNHIRPRRNEPALLQFTLRQVAQRFNVTPEHLARSASQVARRVFNMA